MPRVYCYDAARQRPAPVKGFLVKASRIARQLWVSRGAVSPRTGSEKRFLPVAREAYSTVQYMDTVGEEGDARSGLCWHVPASG